MLMVKPGMTCLDIARQIKDKVCFHTAPGFLLELLIMLAG